MKLSARTRYGIRLLFLIGISSDKLVNIKTLVSQTNLSEKYLEQIANSLGKGQVLRSIRGAGGGYQLTREPSDISLRQIVDALDDSLEISDCISNVCGDQYCPNKKVFRKIYDQFNATLESISLQDIIDDNNCTSEKNLTSRLSV